jgi:hypothetical protein
MKSIEEAIEFLSNNFDKKLSDEKIREFYNIVENYRQINGNKKIIEILSKKYRPSFIEEYSVGSYLWGCSQNYYGDVNKACSLLCINSIPFDENKSTCQYSIWYYDKALIKVADVLSSKAYIYVNKNWNSFTKSDIEELKNCGIYFASILTTLNSKHKILINMTSVDNLPISKEINLEYQKKDNNNNIYFLIFLIFAVLIFYRIRK